MVTSPLGKRSRIKLQMVYCTFHKNIIGLGKVLEGNLISGLPSISCALMERGKLRSLHISNSDQHW